MKNTNKASTLIYPQYCTIDGLAIRFAESEDPKTNIHALLLSPWPESMFAFEATWAKLSEYAHLVAIDLPGFGLSEYSEKLMSPMAMGDFLIRIADKFGLEHPHLVGPDVGTGAALCAAASNPGRFKTITVGSGAASFPVQVSGVLKEWVEAPDLEPYRQIDGRVIVEVAITTFENYKPSDIAHQDYLAGYRGERFAESMRYVQAYPKDLETLGKLLPSIQTPVLIIAGKRDQVVPFSNAEYLDNHLPNSKIAVSSAGHFTWEDAADEYAGYVIDWWEKSIMQNE